VHPVLVAPTELHCRFTGVRYLASVGSERSAPYTDDVARRPRRQPYTVEQELRPLGVAARRVQVVAVPELLDGAWLCSQRCRESVAPRANVDRYLRNDELQHASVRTHITALHVPRAVAERVGEAVCGVHSALSELVSHSYNLAYPLVDSETPLCVELHLVLYAHEESLQVDVHPNCRQAQLRRLLVLQYSSPSCASGAAVLVEAVLVEVGPHDLPPDPLVFSEEAAGRDLPSVHAVGEVAQLGEVVGVLSWFGHHRDLVGAPQRRPLLLDRRVA
jgi:hypothetical protein